LRKTRVTTTNRRRNLALIALGVVLVAAVTSAVSAPLAASSQAGAAQAAFDWYFQGDDNGDEVGYSVNMAGDVDGDGIDDVIVGARRDTLDVDREGAVYVFHGTYGGPGDLPEWTATSGMSGSLFGGAVGTAGDVDGDGFDDVIVGASDYNDGVTKTGAAFVYHGSSGGLSPAPGWSYLSHQQRSDLGYSVGTAGDVNGDGYDDVIVGARWYSVTQTNEGAVFVFYGSASGLSIDPDWMAAGGQPGAGLGTSVGTAGDVNGDGYDDVIVGAPQYDGDQAGVGAVFVFHGSEDGLGAMPGWQKVGDQPDADFGASVGTAGDVNGDGYADVIVGAPDYNNGQVYEGAAWVFLGSGSGLSPYHRWFADGDQSEAAFGISVGTAGDVNGDSYDDVVVGAYRYTGDQRNEGAVFLYLGRAAGLHSPVAWMAEGDKADASLGRSVALAGEINADGYADLIAGAPTYKHDDKTPLGRAFGYFGAPLEIRYSIFLPVVSHAYDGGAP